MSGIISVPTDEPGVTGAGLGDGAGDGDGDGDGEGDGAGDGAGDPRPHRLAEKAMAAQKTPALLRSPLWYK